MSCTGKLAAPGADVRQYLAFVERKVNGVFPLGPRGNDEGFIRDALAILQEDVTTRLGVLGFDRLDNADLDLAISLLEESVKGDERGLFELGGLADDETQSCGQGYRIRA